jgi:hypothetical protein
MKIKFWFAMVLAGMACTSASERPQMCYADFPCSGYNFSCRGTSKYVATVSRDCHETCGPGPCTGASCGPVGPEIECPAGTRCFSRQEWRGADAGAPCGQVDAGVDGYAGDTGSDADSPEGRRGEF